MIIFTHHEGGCSKVIKYSTVEEVFRPDPFEVNNFANAIVPNLGIANQLERHVVMGRYELHNITRQNLTVTPFKYNNRIG